MRNLAVTVAVIACAQLCWAGVVDATKAEAAYRRGDYQEAMRLFTEVADSFRGSSTDSGDPATYREAGYIYDRLANCSFTQRDWANLKHYTDGLLVVSVSERNLCENRLAGALESGIALASAKHLSDQLDEAVRLSTIYQLKRSLALILYEADGKGQKATAAVGLFQQLAALMASVVVEESGTYLLDIDELDRQVEVFDSIFDQLEALGDIDALWDRHPPGGDGSETEGTG